VTLVGTLTAEALALKVDDVLEANVLGPEVGILIATTLALEASIPLASALGPKAHIFVASGTPSG
jgi:hypothetical protein